MIHPEPETRRIVKVRVTVEVDLCGLHDHQEQAMADVMRERAHACVVKALAEEPEAFRPQRTWDVNSRWEREVERT